MQLSATETSPSPSTESESRSGASAFPWFWRALAYSGVAFLALAVKAPEFVLPMGQDQAMYHYVGQLILQGGAPYRDVWDVKPPGIYYTHAALLSLIADPWRACDVGPIRGLVPSRLSPLCGSLVFHAADYLFTLLAGWLVVLVARQLGPRWPWTLAAFAFFTLTSSLSLINAEGSTPEKYLLLPALLSVWAGLRWLRRPRWYWLVAVGTAGALAALYKQPGAASMGAVTLYLVLACWRGWHGLSPSRLPAVVLGIGASFVAVLAVAFGTFALLGFGGDLWEATVLYNVSRAGVDRSGLLRAAVIAAWHIARDGLAPLWLLAGVGLFAARRLPVGGLLLLWAALDTASLFLGGTKFTRVYFMQLVPSYSLLATLALRELWGSGLPASRLVAQRAWLGISVLALVVLSGSFQAMVTLRAWNDYFAHGWSTTSIEDLAKAIRELPASERVFIWGDDEQLYLLTGARHANRYISAVGLSVSGDDSVYRRRQELMRSLEQEPPAVVVVDRVTTSSDESGSLLLNLKTFPELQSLLDRAYQRVELTQLRTLGDLRVDLYARAAPPVCPILDGCRPL